MLLKRPELRERFALLRKRRELLDAPLWLADIDSDLGKRRGTGLGVLVELLDDLRTISVWNRREPVHSMRRSGLLWMSCYSRCL